MTHVSGSSTRDVDKVLLLEVNRGEHELKCDRTQSYSDYACCIYINKFRRHPSKTMPPPKSP